MSHSANNSMNYTDCNYHLSNKTGIYIVSIFSFRNRSSLRKREVLSSFKKTPFPLSRSARNWFIHKNVAKVPDVSVVT